MNRRGFIGAAVAAVMGWMGWARPKTDGEFFLQYDDGERVPIRMVEPEKLARFWLGLVCTWPDGNYLLAWKLVPVKDLRDGDLFQCSHTWATGHLFQAVGDAYQLPHAVGTEGVWTIRCNQLIQPAPARTVQVVPCPPAPPA
jgi:hypothetical protein